MCKYLILSYILFDNIIREFREVFQIHSHNESLKDCVAGVRIFVWQAQLKLGANQNNVSTLYYNDKYCTCCTDLKEQL